MKRLYRSDQNTRFLLNITPETAQWKYISFKVAKLGPNETIEADTGTEEMIIVPLAGRGKLLAQAMDINFHRVGSDVAGQPEDLVLDQLLGNNPPLAAHQQLEHRNLAGGQRLRLVIDECLPAFGVENEIGQLQRSSEQLAGPSSSGRPRSRMRAA